jgi:hypothetical protein
MLVLTVDVFRSLAAVDAALAAEAKAGGCPSCGGRLDRADYARSVRGLPQSAKPFFEKRYGVPHHEVDTSSCWKPLAIRVWDRAS